LSALGERVVAAGMTFQAGNVVMQGNSISETVPPDARAPADDSPGGFMAENARRRHGCVLDFFDVGRADTTGGYLYKQFL